MKIAFFWVSQESFATDLANVSILNHFLRLVIVPIFSFLGTNLLQGDGTVCAPPSVPDKPQLGELVHV